MWIEYIYIIRQRKRETEDKLTPFEILNSIVLGGKDKPQIIRKMGFPCKSSG